MTVFGWDASDFDRSRGPMDVAAAVRDGVSFFTHKATEGTSIRHVHYGDALGQARTAGVPLLGAYMVVRTPGNNGHGPVADQVAYFLSYLDAATPWWRSTPEFFLQVDTEHWGYDDVSPAIGAQACNLLRQRTGKWVVHYAPRWAYGDMIPGTDPLWASAYGSNPAVAYRQAYRGDTDSGWQPYSGRTPTFLQFGSKATIGTQPGCDINAYRGTVDQLYALITGGDDMTPELEAALTAAFVGPYNTAGDPRIGGQAWLPLALEHPLHDLTAAVADLKATLGGAATQEQVDSAVAKKMDDPAWLAKFAAAVASHIHVS